MTSQNELEAALKALLSNGPPLSLEPLKSHPLKLNKWIRSNGMVTHVLEVYELSLKVHVFWSQEPLKEWWMECNRWILESDIAEGKELPYNGSN